MNLIVVVLANVSGVWNICLWVIVRQQMCVCMCIDLHEYNAFIRFSLFCLMANTFKLVGHFISSVAMCMSVRLLAELCISLEHIEQFHPNSYALFWPIFIPPNDHFVSQFGSYPWSFVHFACYTSILSPTASPSFIPEYNVHRAVKDNWNNISQHFVGVCLLIHHRNNIHST